MQVARILAQFFAKYVFQIFHTNLKSLRSTHQFSSEYLVPNEIFRPIPFYFIVSYLSMFMRRRKVRKLHRLKIQYMPDIILLSGVNLIENSKLMLNTYLLEGTGNSLCKKILHFCEC